MTTRTSRIESLESISLMDGVSDAAALALIQDNTISQTNSAMVGNQAWTDEGREAWVASALTNPSVAGVGAVSSQYREGQRELGADLDRKEEMETDHAALEAHIAEDEAAFARMDADLGTIETNLGALEAQITTLPNDINALTARIASLTAEDTVVEKQITVAEREHKACTIRYNSIVSSRTVTEKSLQSTTRSMDSIQRIVTRYEEYVARFPNRPIYATYLQNYRNILGSYQGRQTTYEIRLEALRTREAAAKEALDKAMENVTTLRERNAKLDADVAATRTEKDAAAQALAAALREQEDKEAMLQNARIAVDALQAEILQHEEYGAWEEGVMDDLAADITRETQELTAARDAILAAVSDVVQNPVTLEDDPDLFEETLALGGGHRESDGSWRMDVAGGGSASIKSWQGLSPASPSVGPTGTENLRRALVAAGITQETVDQTAKLATDLRLAEGYPSYPQNPLAPLFNATFTQGTLGSVHIVTSNGVYDPWIPIRFITVKDGTVASGVFGGWNAQGQPNYHDFGRGKITFTLQTPSYVQWVDVERLGVSGSATLEITKGNGSTITIPVSGTMQVPVDAVVRSMTLRPNGDTAAFGIRRIETDAPDLPALPEGDVLETTGGVTALDFHESGKRVTRVKFTSLADRPGTVLTVHLYNGEEETGTVTVPANGLVDFSDPDGITSGVITKSNPSASVFITDMTIEGWADLPQAEAGDLCAETNKAVGMGASFFTPPTQELLNAAIQREGIQTGKVWYEANPNFFAHVLVHPDPSKYTLYELPSAGTATVESVRFINNQGNLGPLDTPDNPYWKSVGASAVIVFPGAPKDLVLRIRGSGRFEVVAHEGSTCDEVMPETGMRLVIDPCAIREGPMNEGWETLEEGYTTRNFHTGPGAIANIVFIIRNEGLGSGNVTVNVHVGQTGTSADPLVSQHTGYVGGFSRQAFSANGAIRQDKDVISIEIVKQDGTVVGQAGRRVDPPRVNEGMSSTETQTRMTSASFKRLMNNIEDAVNNSPTLAGWRSEIADSGLSTPTYESMVATFDVLVQSRLNEENAILELIRAQEQARLEAILARQRGEEGGDDEEGGDTSNWYALYEESMHSAAPAPIDLATLDAKQTMEEALQWFEGYAPDGIASLHGKTIDTNMMMGKLFIGFHQKIVAAQDNQEIRELCAKMGKVTGLDQEKLWNLAGIRDSRRFFERLEFLFTQEMGMGHIFRDYTPASGDPMHAATNDTHYRNGTVRVFFDQPNDPDGQGYAFTRVYLINGNTGEQIDWKPGEEHFAQVADQLFADLSVEWIGEAVGQQTVPLFIKVGGWPTGATDASQVIRGFSDKPFVVEWDGSRATDSSFAEMTTLTNRLSGIQFGVNWDDRYITSSCVRTVRAFVSQHTDYYLAPLPLVSNTEGGFTGAARFMQNVYLPDENGILVEHAETQVPNYTKTYRNQVPENTLPSVGSLLIWNTTIGEGSGHIAIVTAVNTSGTVTVIDSNWNTEDTLELDEDGNPIRVGVGSIHEVRNFENVIGWMTPATMPNQ